MSMVPVSVHFQNQRPLSGNAMLLCKRACLLHSQHVHSIHFKAWNVVSTFIILRRLCRSPLCRSHAKVVVFAHVNDRQGPQSGHIHRFEKLALVRGTIAIQSEGAVGLLPVLLGKGNPSSQRRLGTHNAIATVKVVRTIVHVHGPSLSFRSSSFTSHELGNDLKHGTPTSNMRAVITIRSDDGIIVGDGCFHAHRDSLLSIVQVAESADEFPFVEDVRGDFHASHAVHGFEEPHQFVLVRLHNIGRRLDVVCFERHGQLHTGNPKFPSPGMRRFGFDRSPFVHPFPP
mmetsp:Transcript_10092/g.61363  ORF Transcript_10092/g.61363 Transcript_10092/m.61363 type:complete len:287 (+) Transcript_10092:1967-2827(+)